jgi:hypothetical protein
MRVLNRTALAKRYAGKWVALRADRTTVVASGANAEQVLRAARKKGVAQPVLSRMPREIEAFIGGYRHRA